MLSESLDRGCPQTYEHIYVLIISVWGILPTCAAIKRWTKTTENSEDILEAFMKYHPGGTMGVGGTDGTPTASTFVIMAHSSDALLYQDLGKMEEMRSEKKERNSRERRKRKEKKETSGIRDGGLGLKVA